MTRLEAAALRVPTARYELVATAASIGVFLVYLLHAVVLIRYPWDWSPDEGLFLDYARRMLQAPETLYPVGTSVPFPLAWTPLLPALLTPIVAWLPQPLAGARVLALVWTAGMAGAVYVLVRRRTTPVAALAAAALALAPMTMTSWYMLVRMDGLMTALWLWAAVLLLPVRVERGETLGWGRALGGAGLLLAAFLAKPTAAVHAAPLVLVWLIVDRRSAVRAAAAFAALGGVTVGALQTATSGGFLAVQKLWANHPWDAVWIVHSLLHFTRAMALPLVAAVIALALVLPGGRGTWRDGTLALWAGGAAAIPALAKYGAGTNYLMPLGAATVVLAGRWLGAWSAAGTSTDHVRGRAALAAAGCAVVAAVAISCAHFPLPTARDAAAAEAFYRALAKRGGPLLALRPEYAYFYLGQPVEVEGSSFVVMLRSGASGIEVVPQRVASRYYRTIVLPVGRWRVESIDGYVDTFYRNAAYVDLGTRFGRWRYRVLVPRDDIPAPSSSP